MGKKSPKKSKMSYRERLDDRRDRREDRRDYREQQRDERRETGITRWEQNQEDGRGLGSGNIVDFFRDAAAEIGGTLIGPLVGDMTGNPALGGAATNLWSNWVNPEQRPTPAPQTAIVPVPRPPAIGYHNTFKPNCTCQGHTNTPKAPLTCEEKAKNYLAKCKNDEQIIALGGHVGTCPTKKTTTKKKTTKKKTTKKKTTKKKKTTQKGKGIMSMCFANS